MLQVTWALLTAVLGIYMVTAGIVGVLRTELTPLPRVFLVGGGISSLLPAGLFERAYWTDIVGVAVFLVLLIFGISQTSRKSRADL